MDISDRCGGVRGRLIGCGKVGRNRQVSGNGGMGRSRQVIGGTSVSNQASERVIRHAEWMQRDAGRSGQIKRGETSSLGSSSLGSHCKTSSLYCAETMGD